MPSVVTVRINSNLFVPNMPADIFVISLSNSMVNYLGLLLIVRLTITICVAAYYLYNLLLKSIKVVLNRDAVIDIYSLHY